MSIPRQLRDKEVLQEWISSIMDEAWEELTPWEQDFVSSVEQQLNRKGHLSFKQEDILEKIYAEKTK